MNISTYFVKVQLSFQLTEQMTFVKVIPLDLANTSVSFLRTPQNINEVTEHSSAESRSLMVHFLRPFIDMTSKKDDQYEGYNFSLNPTLYLESVRKISAIT